MARDFPKLVKSTNPQIQNHQQTMQDKYKENKPKNIIVKLLKPNCKQQIFKASNRTRYIVYNIERGIM